MVTVMLLILLLNKFVNCYVKLTFCNSESDWSRTLFLIKMIISHLMIKPRMSEFTPQRGSTFALMTQDKNYGESYAHKVCTVCSFSSVTL